MRSQFDGRAFISAPFSNLHKKCGLPLRERDFKWEGGISRQPEVRHIAQYCVIFITANAHSAFQELTRLPRRQNEVLRQDDAQNVIGRKAQIKRNQCSHGHHHRGRGAESTRIGWLRPLVLVHVHRDDHF